jgi:hypothetical protein
LHFCCCSRLFLLVRQGAADAGTAQEADLRGGDGAPAPAPLSSRQASFPSRGPLLYHSLPPHYPSASVTPPSLSLSCIGFPLIWRIKRRLFNDTQGGNLRWRCSRARKLKVPSWSFKSCGEVCWDDAVGLTHCPADGAPPRQVAFLGFGRRHLSPSQPVICCRTFCSGNTSIPNHLPELLSMFLAAGVVS